MVLAIPIKILHLHIAETAGYYVPELLHNPDLSLQLGGLPQVVGVLKRDDVPSRNLEAPIARRRRT
jgi:hypothetical protein